MSCHGCVWGGERGDGQARCMTDTHGEPLVGESSHPEDVAETMAENHTLPTPRVFLPFPASPF